VSKIPPSSLMIAIRPPLAAIKPIRASGVASSTMSFGSPGTVIASAAMAAATASADA